ncbi:hypothetical protein HK414_15585 [Ramlibacter terrae]|uniref:Uncharacterized protein n=1 Tax=Ramlibacter terrae TaxID=2732511 RepID=A0ABX6P3E4_9BURK|nr:hypothetical protein HK414_15585 [Ramlibacter terrae]
MHADHVGTHELVFKTGGGAGCAGTGCSYQDGDKLKFVVHGDSRLTLPGGKVLTAPFNRSYGGKVNLHEIIWLDAEAKIEYALSDNPGAFNEINVGDMAKPVAGGLPRFLGQLRGATNDTLSALTAHAGTYKFGFQYSGAAVAWTSVTIGDDGSITFEGGSGPNVKPADIVELFDRTGCCGRIDVQVKKDLNTPANGIDGQDKISLHPGREREAAQHLLRPANANNSSDDVGVRLGTVTALTHSGAAVPSGRAVNGTVNGAALNFAPHSTSSILTQGMNLMAQGGDTGPGWMIQAITGTLAEGTYSCNQTNTGSRPR